MPHSRWADEQMALLRSGVDSDFTIHCEGESFKVYKSTIEKEPWFYALINGGFKESQEGQATIGDTCALALATILFYMHANEHELKYVLTVWPHLLDPRTPKQERQDRRYSQIRSCARTKSERWEREGLFYKICSRRNAFRMLEFKTYVQAHELAERFCFKEKQKTVFADRIVNLLSVPLSPLANYLNYDCPLTLCDVPTMLMYLYRHTTTTRTQLRGRMLSLCNDRRDLLNDTDVDDAADIMEVLTDEDDVSHDWRIFVKKATRMRKALFHHVEDKGLRSIVETTTSWGRTSHMLTSFWGEYYADYSASGPRFLPLSNYGNPVVIDLFECMDSDKDMAAVAAAGMVEKLQDAIQWSPGLEQISELDETRAEPLLVLKPSFWEDTNEAPTSHPL